MKKIILTMAVVLTASFANAQDGASFGVKGGLDLVSLSSEGQSTSATGFFVGGFVEFGIADKFMLQPGLNYHTASEDGFNFSYLSVPVLAKYEIAEKFNLMAGPSLFYSMESEVEDKTTFNFDLGASYNFSDNFFLEPRYSLGLSGDTKVSHFLIGVGYKF
jgi:opacity protein-like surface antigen